MEAFLKRKNDELRWARDNGLSTLEQALLQSIKQVKSYLKYKIPDNKQLTLF